MSRLSDVTNAAIQKLIGYATLVKGVLAANAATFNTTAIMTFKNNGVLLTKAAITGGSLALDARSFLNYVQPTLAVAYPDTGSGNLLNGKVMTGVTVYYTLGLDAAGAIVVIQGSYAGQKLSSDPTKGIGSSQAGAAWVGDGSIPDVPDGVTPFGVFKVVTTTGTFTPGTTSLAAAGVAATAFDISVLPVGLL